MRFQFRARLKQGILFTLLLTIAGSSLLSLGAVIAPQKAHAQSSFEDFTYTYIVHDNKLTIRAYNGDDCGGGGPEGPAAMEFISLDGGVNFGPTHLDADCVSRNGGPLLGLNGSAIEDFRNLPNIFVGQRARDGVLRLSGLPDNPIEIGHPERVAAYRTCYIEPGGGGTQQCVEQEADRVAAEQEAQQAANDDNETTCEESGVMTWILCPVIKILDQTVAFLDEQIQALLTIPESDYTAPELRVVWARMRNIALIILVPIMLVMVIGTALGFDFVSAYTVKRALPRLIIAALFIVLSWNIMIFLITLTNNVGNGILGLMTSAFGGQNGAITLSSLFDPGNTGRIFQILVTGGAVYGAVSVASTAPGLVMLFAGVVVLALLVGFAVLTLRQMLILALVLVSPLAILAWIFPGNDKLWKIWWQTFSKLLIMFPMLMLLIGAGRVMALVVSQTRTDFADSVVGVIFKILAWVLPYFFIFAIIKATSPALNALSGGIFALQNRAQKGLANRYKERGMDQLKTQSLQRRERIQNWAQTKQTKSAAKDRGGVIGRARGRAFRTAMGGVSAGAGGYYLQAGISEQRAKRDKEMSEVISSGDDTEIRAAATDANLIEASKGGVAALQRAGFTEGKDYKVGEDGKLQLKNISGNYYDAAKAQAGHARWGKDQYALQKAVSYEMYKSASEDEANNIADNFTGFADSHGINEEQASSMWIGAGYQNAGTRLEYKHMSRDKATGKMKLNAKSFAKELHEKKGTYPVSQLGSSTIKRMEEAYNTGDASVKAQIAESVETFTSRMAPGAQYGQAEGDNGQPIMAGAGGIGAAPHTEKRLQELAQHIRVQGGGGPAPGGPRPPAPPAPPPSSGGYGDPRGYN